MPAFSITTVDAEIHARKLTRIQVFRHTKRHNWFSPVALNCSNLRFNKDNWTTIIIELCLYWKPFPSKCIKCETERKRARESERASGIVQNKNKIVKKHKHNKSSSIRQKWNFTEANNEQWTLNTGWSLHVIVVEFTLWRWRRLFHQNLFIRYYWRGITYSVAYYDFFFISFRHSESQRLAWTQYKPRVSDKQIHWSVMR